MKLRAPSPPVLREVPALIAKRATGGASWRGADEYGTTKPGAELLATSLEGKTPRERSREVARLLAGSRLRRHCDHWSLSVDPRLGKLSDDQWRQAAELFLTKMMYEGCAYTLTRHVDTKVDHCHLLVLRRRGDGSTVSDSNDFKRGHAAAIAAAEGLGLKPLPAREDAAAKPAPTDSQVGAAKRARARGTMVQKPVAVAAAFESVVARSATLDELQERATEAGLDVLVVRKSGGTIQGLNVKVTGAVEWQKASGLRKDGSLSWAKVELRMIRNAELRVRAQAEADRINQSARDRAADRVAARLAKQSEHALEVLQPVRALTPAAAIVTKEKIMSDETDPLHFLSTPPPHRPHGQALDDADLAPATTGSPSEPPAETDEDDRARHERIELEQAEIELDNSFRRMTFDELLDIKNAKIPPILISAAQWLALLNLITRIFSLGLIRRSNSFAESISAKESLAARAAVEIARRKRTPNGVQEKMKVLTEFEKAVKSRALELQKRASIRASIRQQSRGPVPGVHTRAELEAGFDRLQVHLRKPTLGALKLALDKAEAAVARRQARVDADTELVGMFGLRVKRGTATQAQAAARAAALAAARRARAAAQRAWDEATETIVAEQGRERAAAAEAQAEQAEAEQQEREVLLLELGESAEGRPSVPPLGLRAERLALDAEALRERIRGVVHDEKGDRDTDAERAAARAEWLALIRKGG